jgi:hypothetical protein
MPDDLDQPPRGYTTADVPTQPERPRRRWRVKLILAAVVIVPVLLFALYTWIALTYAYSRGERAGYVQKFSKKGWICKTWEGELAMVNLPGAAQEKFYFSVRDDAVAQRIERDMGRRVSLTYEQHRGVPTSCFGETEYFVTNVHLAE